MRACDCAFRKFLSDDSAGVEKAHLFFIILQSWVASRRSDLTVQWRGSRCTEIEATTTCRTPFHKRSRSHFQNWWPSTLYNVWQQAGGTPALNGLTTQIDSMVRRWRWLQSICQECSTCDIECDDCDAAVESPRDHQCLASWVVLCWAWPKDLTKGCACTTGCWADVLQQVPLWVCHSEPGNGCCRGHWEGQGKQIESFLVNTVFHRQNQSVSTNRSINDLGHSHSWGGAATTTLAGLVFLSGRIRQPVQPEEELKGRQPRCLTGERHGTAPVFLDLVKCLWQIKLIFPYVGIANMLQNDTTIHRKFNLLSSYYWTHVLTTRETNFEDCAHDKHW